MPNSRRKRRLKLERWRQAKENEPRYGTPLIVAFANWLSIQEAIRRAARTGVISVFNLPAALLADGAGSNYHSAVMGFDLAHGESFSAQTMIIIDEPSHDDKPTPQLITLDELREAAGGDGANMGGVRFTAEGGFSLN